MTSTSVSAAADAAAPLSVASVSLNKAGAIASAAHDLLPHLERGQRIDATVLRTAMESAFGASDADSGWDWKTAYDLVAGHRPVFASSVRPCARGVPGRDVADAGQDRGPASHPHAPLGRERSASTVSARPLCWGLRRAPRRRSRRRHRAGAFGRNGSVSPSWSSCQAHRSFSTSSPKPAQNFSRFSFPASPSPVSSRAYRRSSRSRYQAKRGADEPAILGSRER